MSYSRGDNPTPSQVLRRAAEYAFTKELLPVTKAIRDIHGLPFNINAYPDRHVSHYAVICGYRACDPLDYARRCMVLLFAAELAESEEKECQCK